ncbi:DNA polymerase III subunit delta [Sporolactobacillus sp. Y61]|jgi:DNA polymerase-3 subunit delta|uniref:DNA polymerase III subunit delta n=1 Tax=Sporolactobacillus sp. Y61 TaxID=3160863 RepID=A0AAU8IEC0_9BACL|nr:DNA polymerase III subunit delta [Sporolactobacillus sp. THM19-2]RYL90382.1 DNA polymerase III subunit delta [Sporolactobacillus sp. THM19-2]
MVKAKNADLSIQKPLAPVYLLFGKQDYLIRLMEKNLINEALEGEDRDFNLSTYDMLKVSLETALEDADTIPFLGEKKAVILENSYFLASERAKPKVEQNPKKLEQYLQNPSPGTVLLLVAPYEKLDRRKKLVKTLEKSARVYELNGLSDHTLYQILSQIVASYGAVYTKSGHEQLVASVGTDLARLASEAGKCALYCGRERPVDREVVLEICSRSLETNVFLLVNKVMQKKTAEALHLVHELISMKEEPLKLLALLERQFRITYQVACYRDAGFTQRSIAGKIGVHPYAVKLAGEQTRLYTPSMLKYALEKCTETDYQIKTGQADKILALELLIHRISETS